MATASTEPGRGAGQVVGVDLDADDRGPLALPVLLARASRRTASRWSRSATSCSSSLWRSSHRCWSSCSAFPARTCRTRARSIPSAPRPAPVGITRWASIRSVATCSRATLYGARVSLQVAFHRHRRSRLVVGTFAGMLAGYYRGWTDTLISRSVDVLLAFPILLLALGPRLGLLARQRLRRRPDQAGPAAW